MSLFLTSYVSQGALQQLTVCTKATFTLTSLGYEQKRHPPVTHEYEEVVCWQQDKSTESQRIRQFCGVSSHGTFCHVVLQSTYLQSFTGLWNKP